MVDILLTATTWLTALDLARGRLLIWGLFLSFWGSDRAPWGHSWGTRPPGMWLRPDNAVHGLSGKFWFATT